MADFDDWDESDDENGQCQANAERSATAEAKSKGTSMKFETDLANMNDTQRTSNLYLQVQTPFFRPSSGGHTVDLIHR